MRLLRHFLVLFVVALGFFPAMAIGAPVKPSLAGSLSVGIPYTGSMAGEDSQNWYHWLRLPVPLRNGDVVQFSFTGSQDSRVCLAPPVDDSDRLDTEEECATHGYTGKLPYVDVDGTRRRDLTWSGPSGVGFLLVASGDCCPYLNNGTYTLTLEQINPNVLIGMPPPQVLPRTFQLPASITLGDNSPAGDGIVGELQWKGTRKTPGPSVWTTFLSTTSLSGQLIFSGEVPPVAQRRIQLRACVLRPAGGRNCTGASTVALRPAETGKCRAARKLNSKLKKRIRQLQRANLQSRQAKTRRLRSANRQIRKVKRAIQKHCVGA